MKERLGIAVGLFIVIVVLASATLYFLFERNIGYGEIFPILIILFLAAVALYILWDRIKNVKKGLPAKDERLITINYKAGYYGFIAAIWSVVGAPILSELLFNHTLEGHYITALVVIISGLVFVISYLALARKGTS